MKKLTASAMAVLCLLAFSFETQARKPIVDPYKDKTSTNKVENKSTRNRAQNKFKSAIERGEALATARKSMIMLSPLLKDNAILAKNVDTMLVKNEAALNTDKHVDKADIDNMILAVNSLAIKPGIFMRKSSVLAKEFETALTNEGVSKEVVEKLKREECHY